MPIKTPKEIEADANARANKINYQAQKRVLMTETANLKAVTSAFQAWLQKAPLTERRAFLDTLAGYAKGTAAERIALFAAGLEEAPQHDAAAPVDTVALSAKPAAPERVVKSDGGGMTA